MLGLFIAIILATVGQTLLSRHDLWGLAPYALAIVVLLIALRQSNRRSAVPDTGHLIPTRPASPGPKQQRRLLNWVLLPFAVVNAVLAFLAAADNTFRWYGVLAWLLAVVLFIVSFWQRGSGDAVWKKLGFSRDGWRASWTTLAIIGLILIGFYFRFWRLNQMPPEMTSDHIEKLLDVHDLDTGERPIFFVRNTGREPWQFYWTLMLMRLFDLKTSFFVLKLGTAFVGLLPLPAVYLLGRDLFNRRVGLWATLFTAVASWGVILSRIGLRFPFAPAATAWSLLYLLRGLRYGRRNDFILLGLWLGIGMQGYTAFRIMPLAVVVCWGLALLARPASLAVRPSSLVRNALLTVLIATVVFIPLGRFSLEHPDDFWRRSASRMADPNQPMSDGLVITLLKNLKNLALVFHWQGDDVWVNTLANAPILDPILGGLLILGLVVVLWRGLRWRDPIAPLLLLAGVILLLPSALSLAYPIENPSAVRIGGAIPAIMIIAALPLGLERKATGAQTAGHREQQAPRGVRRSERRRWRRALWVLAALALAIAVTTINYRRYFVDYWNQYQRNALNTTEIASAIAGFIESGGDPADAWIIAWPYWIDTRGVGIEIGDPPWNNVILKTEELNEHASLYASGTAGGGDAGPGRPRLYVLHLADRGTLERLRSLFPTGWSSLYVSKHPRRSFMLYYVPRISKQSTYPTGAPSTMKTPCVFVSSCLRGEFQSHPHPLTEAPSTMKTLRVFVSSCLRGNSQSHHHDLTGTPSTMKTLRVFVSSCLRGNSQSRF